MIYYYNHSGITNHRFLLLWCNACFRLKDKFTILPKYLSELSV